VLRRSQFVDRPNKRGHLGSRRWCRLQRLGPVSVVSVPMLATRTRDHTRPFYGWVVVAAVFVVLAMTAGLGFYNASVILRQAKDELGASVSVVSGATALFFGVSGASGFGLSKLMDRVDLRWFFGAGAVLGAGALAGLRFVDSVFDLYVFFVVFGVAFALAGLVPSTTIVARWFDQRRSVALSVASTGLSFGGIAVTPFVARFIENESLGGAGPWLGLAWLLGIAPIAFLFIRSWPSDMGLEPDGAPAPAVSKPAVGATLAEAASTRFFWSLSATYALIFLSQVGAIAQLFNLVTERVDSSLAATALSTMALSSIVGRLVGGVIVTRFPPRALTSLLILVQAVALVLLAQATTRNSILFGVAVLGVSIGNLLMLQPLLIAETFGVRSYSRIYSFCQLIGTIGVAGGPFVLGALRDLYSYEVAFYVAAATCLGGIATLFAAGPTDRARSTWDGQVGDPAVRAA